MRPDNLFSRFVLLIFLIGVSFPAAAQPATDQSQPLAERIAEHLALKYQLAEAPEDIRLQFEQNPLRLPAETNKQMLSHFKDAYDNEIMLTDFTAALEERIPDSHRPDLENWLEDANTRSITDTRQEFYTLEGKRKRVITMYEMDQEPPADDRIALVASITDTTSVVESTVESSVIVLRSVIEALSNLSTQQSFTDPQIDAIANNFRSQIEGPVKEEFNTKMLVLFHNTDTPVLQEYISFWGTEAGQWLDQAISQSINETYQAAAERFLESVNTDQ